MALIHCPECGNEISEHSKACIHCGYPLEQGETMVEENGRNNIRIEPATIPNDKAERKKGTKTVIVVVIIGICVILGLLIVTKLFVSVEKLCAQGKYEAAYQKAPESQKKEIEIENYAAVLSATSASEMGNPSLFKLLNIYYVEETAGNGGTAKYLTLQISSDYRYGVPDTEYWLYIQGGLKNSWELACHVSNLREEEYDQYDDSDSLTEKMMNNLGRSIIALTMDEEKGIRLSTGAVGRINTMLKTGVIDKVELLHADGE